VRRSALIAVLSILVSTIAMAPWTSTAAAAEDYPVPYDFLPSAVYGGATRELPGANDWSCEPTKAHPRPVVLVHGTFATKEENWQTYAPLLANNGYCVFALDYGHNPAYPGADYVGGLLPMEQSAQELKEFVAKVRAATGARKVDLVGHSQGTLMPNYYVKFLGGADSVKKYVSLASLWHGTNVAQPSKAFALLFGREEATPFCQACGQFPPGSDFMTKMRGGGGPAVDGVDYTNIVTVYDELVVPYWSGIEPGMRNVVLQNVCPQDGSEHGQIAASPNVARIVLNTLDPARAEPVQCRVVTGAGTLPF
jgi:triacylglycerol lipase